MHIHCSTCSVIWNVIATCYSCLLNSIYHPHWLVQWHCHCSHMLSPVHSPWLPGYVDVVQTVLIILTMAGLFPGRPCMSPVQPLEAMLIGILATVWHEVFKPEKFLCVPSVVWPPWTWIAIWVYIFWVVLCTVLWTAARTTPAWKVWCCVVGVLQLLSNHLPCRLMSSGLHDCVLGLYV